MPAGKSIKNEIYKIVRQKGFDNLEKRKTYKTIYYI